MRYSWWGEGSRAPGRAITVAGLACVYSGIPWLVFTIGALTNGWFSGAAACAVCLGGALAVGVGLCAGERWAWAAATCLAALYAVGSAAIAAVLGLGLATAGPRLSWQPVAVGLTFALAIRVALAAGFALAAAATALRVLWRAQPEFDVPYRKSFTTLLHDGLVPSALVLMADLFLLYHAWSTVAVRG